uniref:Uncharacterized protein n=1 Tax=Arundo donax TaxID=35708 RepID=A0A0A9CMS9_ARUDO
MKRKQHLPHSLQQRLHYGGYMLLRRMMTCLLSRPFSHHWKLSSNWLVKRLLNCKMITGH